MRHGDAEVSFLAKFAESSSQIWNGRGRRQRAAAGILGKIEKQPNELKRVPIGTRSVCIEDSSSHRMFIILGAKSWGVRRAGANGCGRLSGHRPYLY